VSLIIFVSARRRRKSAREDIYVAQTLGISVDKLLMSAASRQDTSYYETEYQKNDYYWGIEPSTMCLRVLECMPPVRPLKLLDIGCGEGKDAVFFARCGYAVSAFDISDAGIEKLKRLAEKAHVHVQVFKANIWDYRLSEEYDILFSSGVLHYITSGIPHRHADNRLIARNNSDAPSN
jgi:tellurite methyltransferase